MPGGGRSSARRAPRRRSVCARTAAAAVSCVPLPARLRRAAGSGAINAEPRRPPRSDCRRHPGSRVSGVRTAPLHVGRHPRPHAPAGRGAARARARLSSRARQRRRLRQAARELGERAGPHRPLPVQRQRVPRGHARRLQGALRAVQRQLPLRRRGAAVPAGQRRRARSDLSRELRADAGAAARSAAEGEAVARGR